MKYFTSFVPLFLVIFKIIFLVEESWVIFFLPNRNFLLKKKINYGKFFCFSNKIVSAVLP